MPAEQSADILLNSVLPLMYARRDSRGGFDSSKPAVLTETFTPPPQSKTVVYDSFENGGAFSRRWLPKTYDRAKNLHMRTPTIVLPAGYAEPVTLPALMMNQGVPISASAVLNGDVFIFAGRYAAVSVNGTGAFSIDYDFGATFYVSSAALWNSTLYVGGYNPATSQPAYIWRRGVGIWQQSSDAAKKLLAEDPVYWVRSAIGRQVWIGTSSVGAQPAYYQHLTLGDDPMVEARWSTPILVGRPEYPINSIGTTPQRVLFGKGEGLFDVDERDFTPNYTPWFRQTYEQTNGSHLAVLNSSNGANAYISHFQGVHRVTINNQRQTASQPCGPGTGTPSETPAFGSPTATCVDGTGWFAAAYHDGIDASVWFGRDRGEMGVQVPGPLVWHGSEFDKAGQRISHMRVISINGDPKLYVGSQLNGAGEVKLWKQSIPLGQNPLQDYLWPQPTSRVASGYHEFAESGELYLPEEDFNAPTALQILRKLRVLAPGLTSSITLEVLASIDSGAYVTQGTATSSYFSVIPSASQQSGRTLKLKLAGTGSRRTPFRFQAVEADADIVYEQSSVIEAPIILGLFQPLGSAQPTGRDPDDLWVLLQDLATREGVVNVSARGIKQEFRAKVMPFGGRQLVQDSHGKPWYLMTTLRLSVVDPPSGFLVWDASTPYSAPYGFQS